MISPLRMRLKSRNLYFILVPVPLNSTQILEDDMMILSVIEAYCFSARQRQNVSCRFHLLWSFLFCFIFYVFNLVFAHIEHLGTFTLFRVYQLSRFA